MADEEKKILDEETKAVQEPVDTAPIVSAKPEYLKAAEAQNAKDVVNSLENVKKYDADRAAALEIKNKTYASGGPGNSDYTPGTQLDGYTPGSQVSGFAPVGNNWDADQTQVYGKLNEPDPLKAKFTDKLRYLAEVDALNSLKEWEAGDRTDMKARSRIKPDTLGTFRKLLKSNAATEKDPLMLAARQDYEKGVGNVVQGLGEGFENFAKGYTGRDWTTAQQKREALEQQDKATAAQNEAIKAARTYEEGQKKAEQEYQTGRDEDQQAFQSAESLANRLASSETERLRTAQMLMTLNVAKTEKEAKDLVALIAKDPSSPVAQLAVTALNNPGGTTTTTPPPVAEHPVPKNGVVVVKDKAQYVFKDGKWHTPKGAEVKTQALIDDINEEWLSLQEKK
jgi:hypothetical protein